jgi:hypothetical protein
VSVEAHVDTRARKFLKQLECDRNDSSERRFSVGLTCGSKVDYSLEVFEVWR